MLERLRVPSRQSDLATALRDPAQAIDTAAALGTRYAAETAAATILRSASERGTLSTVATADLETLADDALLAADDADALAALPRLSRLTGLRARATDEERADALTQLATLATVEADARALDLAQWQTVADLLAGFASAPEPAPTVAKPARLTRHERHRLHALQSLVAARVELARVVDSFERERHPDAKARKGRAVERATLAMQEARDAWQAFHDVAAVRCNLGAIVVEEDLRAKRREVERVRSLRAAANALRSL